MPTSYAGSPGIWENISAPVSGDPAIAASVQDGFNDCANRTATLRDGTVTFTGAKTFSDAVTVNAALTAASTLAVTGATTLTGAATANGAVTLNGATQVNSGTFKLLNDKKVELNSRDIQKTHGIFRYVPADWAWTISSGASFLADTNAAGARVILVVLQMPHNSDWRETHFFMQGPSAAAGLPSNMPTLGLYKVAIATGVATAIVSPVADAPADLAAYKAYHKLTPSPSTALDTNEKIDNYNYYYVAQFTTGSGTNAVAGTGMGYVRTVNRVDEIEEG